MAFTLVELMVAIGVMAILAGILFSAMNQNQNAPRLETAQMILSQAFANARSQAILKQRPSRIIIYAKDPTTIEEAKKYLRFFAVIIQSETSDSQWDLAMNGEYLPEGIYFIPNNSDANISWRDGRMTSRYKESPSKLDISFRNNELIQSDPEWIFYQYEPNGRINVQYNSIGVILAHGMAGDLKPDFDDSSPLLGFNFTSNGLPIILDEEIALTTSQGG